jgi:hypothetical protein
MTSSRRDGAATTDVVIAPESWRGAVAAAVSAGWLDVQVPSTLNAAQGRSQPGERIDIQSDVADMVGYGGRCD